MKIEMLQITSLSYAPGADMIEWSGVIALNGAGQGARLFPKAVAVNLTKEEIKALHGIVERLQGEWPREICRHEPQVHTEPEPEPEAEPEKGEEVES